VFDVRLSDLSAEVFRVAVLLAMPKNQLKSAGISPYKYFEKEE